MLGTVGSGDREARPRRSTPEAIDRASELPTKTARLVRASAHLPDPRL